MICPRCNEEINEFSGHPIESISGGDDYSFLTSSEKEQDVMPITPMKYK